LDSGVYNLNGGKIINADGAREAMKVGKEILLFSKLKYIYELGFMFGNFKSRDSNHIHNVQLNILRFKYIIDFTYIILIILNFKCIF